MNRKVIWIALGASAVALIVAGLVQAAADAAPGEDGTLGERLGAFLAQVQEAAAGREVELRAALGLDGRHDTVDDGAVRARAEEGSADTTSGAGDNLSATPGIIGENQ